MSDLTGAERMTIPLTQTVFLPKTAMGVRYIDKIRATVFIDDLQRSEDGVRLRGFYELDLEYQGVEGRGLNKHRVMLPLKVQPPAGWLEGIPYEAADLHGTVSRPMIKILSPYVLDFSGTLNLAYVGNYRWPEAKAVEPASAPAEHIITPTHRVWSSDIPLPDADAMDKRIASKIDRFFLGKTADEKKPPRAISQADAVPAREAAADIKPKAALRITRLVPESSAEMDAPAEAESRIPVWHFPAPDISPAQQVANAPARPAGIPVFDPLTDSAAADAPLAEELRSGSMEQIYAPGLNKSRFRTLLTEAALARLKARGEDLAAAAAERQEQTAENEQPQDAAIKEADTLTEEDIITTTAAEPPEQTQENAAVKTAETDVEAEIPAMMTADAPAQQPETLVEAAAEAAATPAAAAAPAEAEVEATEAAASAPQPAVDSELKMVNAQGVRLKVLAAQQPARAAFAVPGAAKKAGSFSLKYYVVKPGDQPMSIALQNNVSLEKLLAANHIGEGELKPGSVLRIPS